MVLALHFQCSRCWAHVLSRNVGGSATPAAMNALSPSAMFSNSKTSKYTTRPTTIARRRHQTPNTMNTPIRNGKQEIVAYHESSSPTREILRDKNGRILGRFENDTGITREASG